MNMIMHIHKFREQLSTAAILVLCTDCILIFTHIHSCWWYFYFLTWDIETLRQFESATFQLLSSSSLAVAVLAVWSWWITSCARPLSACSRVWLVPRHSRCASLGFFATRARVSSIVIRNLFKHHRFKLSTLSVALLL